MYKNISIYTSHTFYYTFSSIFCQNKLLTSHFTTMGQKFNSFCVVLRKICNFICPRINSSLLDWFVAFLFWHYHENFHCCVFYYSRIHYYPEKLTVELSYVTITVSTKQVCSLYSYWVKWNSENLSRIKYIIKKYSI